MDVMEFLKSYSNMLLVIFTIVSVTVSVYRVFKPKKRSLLSDYKGFYYKTALYSPAMYALFVISILFGILSQTTFVLFPVIVGALLVGGYVTFRNIDPMDELTNLEQSFVWLKFILLMFLIFFVVIIEFLLLQFIKMPLSKLILLYISGFFEIALIFIFVYSIIDDFLRYRPQIYIEVHLKSQEEPLNGILIDHSGARLLMAVNDNFIIIPDENIAYVLTKEDFDEKDNVKGEEKYETSR